MPKRLTCHAYLTKQEANEHNSAVIGALLADIAVNAPRDDIGALMEREVLAGFSTLGTQPADPRYLLQLNPRWLDQEVAIEQDTEVTRRNITVQTSFELYEVASNERIFSGEAVSQASYNRVTSEYANIIAARNATSRTVEAVAQDIRLKVAAFLAQRNAG